MTAALAANPTQRYRWVILLIATFAQACACFFVQGIGAIAVFIQNDLQLSSLQIACWCRRRSWCRSSACWWPASCSTATPSGWWSASAR